MRVEVKTLAIAAGVNIKGCMEKHLRNEVANYDIYRFKYIYINRVINRHALAATPRIKDESDWRTEVLRRLIQK